MEEYLAIPVTDLLRLAGGMGLSCDVVQPSPVQDAFSADSDNTITAHDCTLLLSHDQAGAVVAQVLTAANRVIPLAPDATYALSCVGDRLQVKVWHGCTVSKNGNV